MADSVSHEKVDAVIVGAGAAGSLLAAKLATSGKSVVVLEAGPAWDLGDLTSSQIWARRLRWGGAAVDVAGAHPYAFTFNSGWGLGGAALHHYATWPRLHEEDFEVGSRYGRDRDWPIGYDDLRPYYDQVQREVGIAGDAEQEIWRPEGDPYPLPPVKTFAQGRIIAKGFDALGMTTAPMPMAITTEEYNGRPACLYDGWCDAGCPIHALANPLVTYLPIAKEHGADIRTGCTVLTVLTDARDHARGVDYVDAGGTHHRQFADVVILAASAVHNPALMLRSVSAAHPDGLGNSSGLVGHYFMAHSVASVFGIFDEETEVHMGVTGAQLTCRDGYGKGLRDHGFGSYQWLIGPATKPNDLLGIAISRADLFGPELDDFMTRAARHLGVMLAMGESMPRAENRIELTNKLDSNGMRGVRIVHEFDADALATWEHAKTEGLRVFKAAGATEAWNGPLAQAHMMGGTIMGSNRETAVTDSFGRSFDVPNLVIAGPGLFPTAGANNPTFTVHALAARTADHLIAHWGDFVQ